MVPAGSVAALRSPAITTALPPAAPVAPPIAAPFAPPMIAPRIAPPIAAPPILREALVAWRCALAEDRVGAERDLAVVSENERVEAYAESRLVLHLSAALDERDIADDARACGNGDAPIRHDVARDARFDAILDTGGLARDRRLHVQADDRRCGTTTATNVRPRGRRRFGDSRFGWRCRQCRHGSRLGFSHARRTLDRAVLATPDVARAEALGASARAAAGGASFFELAGRSGCAAGRAAFRADVGVTVSAAGGGADDRLGFGDGLLSFARLDCLLDGQRHGWPQLDGCPSGSAGRPYRRRPPLR